MSRLSRCRASLPNPNNGIPDSISWLGGRQQLTVSVLEKALGEYFEKSQLSVEGNDVVIKAKEDHIVRFSGAQNAVIEDHKFSLVVKQCACSAGLTLLRADRTEIMSRPLLDSDAVCQALAEFWPENEK